MKSFAVFSLIAVVALSTAALSTSAVAQDAKAAATMSAEQAREENAYTVGLQAFLWGYRNYPPPLRRGGIADAVWACSGTSWSA